MTMTGRPFAAAAGVLLTALASLLTLPAAQAQNIIDQWTSVKVPPAPVLKPVTVDAKTTALLVLGFTTKNCGKRPHCIATIPAVKTLLDEARAAKATVVYSIVTGTTAADVVKDLAPMQDEPSVISGPDKFINTDLGQILADKGIKTVIATGTASNGSVLFTGAGAVMRGMSVIVPIDTLSGENDFDDLTTVYTFAYGPVIAEKSTLTKVDMIKF